MHKLSSILLAMLLWSCKHTPQDVYEELPKGRTVFSSFKAAIDASEEIEVLHKEQIQKGKLQMQDSVIVIESENTWLSNYQLFAFPAKGNQAYQLRIKSICDCLGARKYMFFPQITVVSDEGKSMKLDLLDEKMIEPQGVTPIHLQQTYSFRPPTTSSYYLFIYAKNNILNEPLTRSKNPTLIHTNDFTFFVDIPYTVKAYPLGKYELEVF